MNRIRHFRELRGVSQVKLAEACSVPQTWISKIERSGITPQKVKAQLSLARALRVSPGELFPDAESTPFEEPLPPKRVLFKSSRFMDPQPAKSAAPAHDESLPTTRTICRWCGMKYRDENEVKIVVGENTIKTYGHLACLEQDVRSDGLELKKRHVPR